VASSSSAANGLGVPFDAASGPAARRGFGCSWWDWTLLASDATRGTGNLWHGWIRHPTLQAAGQRAVLGK
jgi:hypothetical protein